MSLNYMIHYSQYVIIYATKVVTLMVEGRISLIFPRVSIFTHMHPKIHLKITPTAQDSKIPAIFNSKFATPTKTNQSTAASINDILRNSTSRNPLLETTAVPSSINILSSSVQSKNRRGTKTVPSVWMSQRYESKSNMGQTNNNW